MGTQCKLSEYSGIQAQVLTLLTLDAFIYRQYRGERGELYTYISLKKLLTGWINVNQVY